MANSFGSEFLLAARLIQAGIFQPINADQLRQTAPNGAVFVACGDRDRFSFYFRQLQDANTELHPLTLNGGGILLNPEIDQPRQAILVEDIGDAFRLKDMRTVILSSHYPCGKAGMLGLGLREILLNTLEGKIALKQMMRDAHVVPLISIDWRPNDPGRETDFIETFVFRLDDMERIRNFT